MIKGKCHTNLDEYRHKRWPTVFARVPNKGEKVRAKDGSTLEVCQITHSEIEKEGKDGFYYHEMDPFIEVELTKTRLISNFGSPHISEI